MKLLAHRGLWHTPAEKNSATALVSAFDHGFGIETDIRDRNAALFVAHDITDAFTYTFDALLGESKKISQSGTIAINIKADGLAATLKKSLEHNNVTDYFCFDMSAPQLLVYIKEGLKSFTRHSEIEPEPVLYDKAAGVWMDQFYSEWIEKHHITEHLDKGKEVCIVSPELHRRDHKKQWEYLRGFYKELQGQAVYLCTDFPVEAKEFFL